MSSNLNKPVDVLKPILVRSFGRSGSTLMMQLLGSSEQCVMERGYPYEDRFLSYIYRLSDVVDKDVINTKDIRWRENEDTSVQSIKGWVDYLDDDVKGLFVGRVGNELQRFGYGNA